MKAFFHTLILATFSFAITANANDLSEIRLTQIFTQIDSEHNKQVTSLMSDGSVQLSFPAYHKLHGKTHEFKTKENQPLFNELDKTWNINSMKNRIQINKQKSSKNQIYFVSDPDILRVQLIEGGITTWEIEFENFELLKLESSGIDENIKLINYIQGLNNISRAYVNDFMESEK